MPENPTPDRPAATASTGAPWLCAVFLSAATATGLLFYLLSQSLQPVLSSAGVDGICLDRCLLVGGLIGLWLSLAPQTRPVEGEAVAQS